MKTERIYDRHHQNNVIENKIKHNEATNEMENMDKHFLASLEKLDTAKMIKHFCKQCNSEFDGPTQIQIEEKPNEAVADGLILIERGQYTCNQCNSIIGEYRVFKKSE